MRVNYEELDLEQDSTRNIYDGKLFTGIAFEEDDQGRLLAEDTFVDGVLHGPSRTYHPSGRIKAEEPVQRGGLHGLCRYWYENGQLEAERVYNNGDLIKERIWNEQGELIKDY